MNFVEKDLTKFSTIRTKSFTDHFCNPQTVEELKIAINYKKEKNLSMVLLGNGSNILFSKTHYKNILFIKLGGEFDFIDINSNNIEIGAAYLLKLAGKKLIKSGYSDYIFFNLIPATVGGAITQNAGTGKGEEIRDVCKHIKVFDIEKNQELVLSNKDCLFEYRSSIIKRLKGRYIVLSAKFKGNNTNNKTARIIVKPDSEEIKIHNNYLKSKLPKNFFD